MGKYVMVFNSAEYPIRIDDNGRMVHPGEWAAVEYERMQRDIVEGRLIEIPLDSVMEKYSTPAAIMVKQEVVRLNEMNEPTDDDALSDAPTTTVKKKRK